MSEHPALPQPLEEGIFTRSLDHVAGTHAGGQQALVRVAHRGVGDEQLLLVQDPLLHRLGPLLVQHLLEAALVLRRLVGHGEAGRVELMALRVGVRHLDVGDVLQDASSTVAALGVELEQLRRLVDELGVAAALAEGLVGQDVRHEGDVGLDTPDVGLPDGAGGLAAGALEGVVPAGDLDQQAVIVGADDGARGGVAAVQADAEAAAGAVGRDLAVVGGEVVLRVLGGDAALDGVAVDMYVVLARQADVRRGERIALRHQDLGPDEIDAGDQLRHRVLHLDAGVHLDEVVPAVLVHQKLQGAGVHIAHALGDLHRVSPDLGDGVLGHAPGGGELHHLLVAALQGTVTLAQVIQGAVLVAQDLDLDEIGRASCRERV